MGRPFEHLNTFLIIPILVLSGFSLALIHSINLDLFWSQLLFFIAGLVIFFLITYIDYRIFQPLWFVIFVISILFLLSSFLGPDVRGSTRWIEIGMFRIQPSEIVKPFLLLVYAAYLSFRPRMKIADIFYFLVLSAVPAFIVFKQPDFGNSIIYVGSSLGLLFLSPASIWFLAAMFGFFSALLPFGWQHLEDYQRLRILSFFSPHIDQAGVGYNAIQALIAIGSGGLLGRGLGKGPQSHLRFLPENHTDFIFASLSEELGFLGATILIVTYFSLLFQLFLIYRKSKTTFSQYFVLGFFIQFFLQIVINIGMNLGLLPITGITLPLISYGGSSIISLFIGLGIIQRISMDIDRERRAIAIG